MLGVLLLIAGGFGCSFQEGESSANNAVVQYQIQIAAGEFDAFMSGPTERCRTDEFEWVANKLLDNGVPVEVPSVFGVNSGVVQQDGTCLFSTLPFPIVPPGEYRLVATDYDWTAACTVTLIAQITSGQFHNVRFFKGAPGCEEEVRPLPNSD
jgi:hypothetical protein